MFHLRVAVRAEKNALGGLRAERVDANRGPLFSHPEPLGSRVNVVELERSHAPVVSAPHASASGLLDQDPFDLSPALGNPIHPALPASNSSTVLDHEHAVSMVPALSLNGASAFGQRLFDQLARNGRTGTPPATRFKPVLLEPVPNGSDAPVELFSDLCECQTAFNKGTEVFLRKRPAGSVLPLAARFESVLLYPVADG